MRLRVLFVIPGAAQGSSMVFARRQAASVRAAGAEVEIFFLRSRTSWPVLLREWRRFRRVSASFRPDVVHAHFGTMTAMFTVLAAGRTPVVITYRGSDLNPVPSARGLRAWLGRLLSQLAALRAGRLVCVSAGLRRRLWWRQSAACVLPSGVDFECFYPMDRKQARRRLGWPEQERVVLFNAGGDPRNKRLDLAQAAVARAQETLGGVRMELLRGDCAPEHVPLLMNAADCLLVASDAEGSPSVLQEALASNLPVVSVPVGDAMERLAGVAGTRIARREAGSLARALVDLVAEPRRAAGRRKAEECSAEKIARELVAIYGQIAGCRN